MKLMVAAALKQPGELYDATMSQELPPELYNGREIIFQKPVLVSFQYSFDGGAFTISGQMQFLLLSRCAGCNEAFEEELVIPFQERFVKGVNSGEEDSYAFDGDTLELTQMVFDNLFLHLPISSKCKEGCRGLCPICGENLNKAQCACMAEKPKEGQKRPLAMLGSLLTDDKEV